MKNRNALFAAATALVIFAVAIFAQAPPVALGIGVNPIQITTTGATAGNVLCDSAGVTAWCGGPQEIGSGSGTVGSGSCTTTITGGQDYCAQVIAVAGALTTDNVLLTQTSAPITGSGPATQHLLYAKITAANTLTVYGYDSQSGGSFSADSGATFNYAVVR